MPEQNDPKDRTTKALEEALVSVKCDHGKIEQPETLRFRKFYCVKCRATFWEPKKSVTGREGTE